MASVCVSARLAQMAVYYPPHPLMLLIILVQQNINIYFFSTAIPPPLLPNSRLTSGISRSQLVHLPTADAN
jgi:hypothetical protein